ncbi:Hypothetical predicted protein, partial [Pelobates cultripes]
QISLIGGRLCEDVSSKSSKQNPAKIGQRTAKYRTSRRQKAPTKGNSMGKRSLNKQNASGQGSQDIGDCRHRGYLIRRGAVHGYPQRATSELRLNHISSEEEDDTPATKRDIKSLLKDIRSLFQAIIREDIHSLTGRVKLTEDVVSGLLTSQTALREAQATTSWAQESLATKMADLEDKSRQNNIKLRGVPEEVATNELPQYLSRLFYHLLPPKREKAIIINTATAYPNRLTSKIHHQGT